jgi:23S rRNA (uracil1939-C5)-methyltransferase
LNQIVYPVKRKQEIQVMIEKMAFGGKGVTRIDDYVIFINNTIPGDEVQARITKRKPNYAQAKLLRIIKPSHFRIEAPCIYFDWCGGCTWQNLAYREQLRYKHEHVRENLAHIANIDEVKVYKTIAAKRIWGYRNKMEFSFSDRRWLLPSELGNFDIDRSFALGMHIPGSFDRVLDIDKCLLQSDMANEVLRIVDGYAQEKGLKPYGIKSHTGFLRFLVIRESAYNNEIMVNVVTAQKKPHLLRPLAEILMKKIPQVSSVINNINSRKAQIAFGEEELVLQGKSHILEKIGEFKVQISANSFFQTNTFQAEQLYKLILVYAQLTGEEIVWDLYSGAGTISLHLARRAKFVYGFEIVSSAVDDAYQNIRESRQNNIKFISGDLLFNIGNINSSPHVIVTDPPRSGMHPKVCEAINQSGAKRVVYVSCNPTTMARDVKLMENNYKLIKVQPLDMFPHTYHIESISQLVKR